MVIRNNSAVVDASVEDIERDYNVSVVLLRRGGEMPEYHPAASRKIAANDTVAVLGGSRQISVLAQRNTQ
jgi:Trk K+ transport system NAD-binding subunit